MLIDTGIFVISPVKLANIGAVPANVHPLGSVSYPAPEPNL